MAFLHLLLLAVLLLSPCIAGKAGGIWPRLAHTLPYNMHQTPFDVNLPAYVNEEGAECLLVTLPTIVANKSLLMCMMQGSTCLPL